MCSTYSGCRINAYSQNLVSPESGIRTRRQEWGALCRFFCSQKKGTSDTEMQAEHQLTGARVNGGRGRWPAVEFTSHRQPLIKYLLRLRSEYFPISLGNSDSPSLPQLPCITEEKMKTHDFHPLPTPHASQALGRPERGLGIVLNAFLSRPQKSQSVSARFSGSVSSMASLGHLLGTLIFLPPPSRPLCVLPCLAEGTIACH